MTKQEAKKRIKKLKKEVEHHRYLYHVLDKQEISDAVLDFLKKELADLEQEYPEFLTSDSPSQRVAGKPLDKFKKIKHPVKQWSFNDAFSKDELADWQQRLENILNKKELPKNLEYVCEPKIDGLHIVLIYKQGLLHKALTRGDGTIGEDVTQNIKTINSIPLRLKQKVDVVVEGEIFMTKQVFAELNKERKAKKQELLANPRNAAAGAIRQLNPKITAKRKLDSYIYDITQASFKLPASQEKELKRLEVLGFKVNQNYTVCATLGQVQKYMKTIEKTRAKLGCWLDGIVVKVNSQVQQKTLGYTGKAPRFALAYKFPAEEAVTVVNDVTVQVGRTGALTPVAELKPVKLAGSIVRRATLHNQDEIKRLKLKIGDTVVVKKAGDIIPNVVKVLPGLRTGKEKVFKMPSKCPVCKAGVVSQKTGKKDEVAIYCSNSSCLAQNKAGLAHFVSKAGFNIEGLGGKIIEQLLLTGLVKNFADIFKLKFEDLEPLERFADKSAENLIVAINKAKKISAHKFLFALGIRYVGQGGASLVASQVSSLNQLAKKTKEDWEAVDGLGEKAATSLWEYFQNQKNIAILNKMEDLGVRVVFVRPKKSSNLSDLSFVITGSLENLSRQDLTDRLVSMGAKVGSSVSKNTNYLVAGKNPGSKLAKAKSLGVKIIDENKVNSLITK